MNVKFFLKYILHFRSKICNQHFSMNVVRSFVLVITINFGCRSESCMFFFISNVYWLYALTFSYLLLTIDAFHHFLAASSCS